MKNILKTIKNNKCELSYYALLSVFTLLLLGYLSNNVFIHPMFNMLSYVLLSGILVCITFFTACIFSNSNN